MIRIIVCNPMDGTKRAAMVPEHAPMRTLVPELAPRGHNHQPPGCRTSYMLQRNEGGELRTLGPGETLASAGVADGEELILTGRVDLYDCGKPEKDTA